jgi:O-antigen/teichoic acid export membrane protein
MLNMFRSGQGNLIGFLPATLLPFFARYEIGATPYAMWALLATVGTVATTLDFGGSTLLAARLGHTRAGALYRRSLLLSLGGSALITALALALWLMLTALGRAPAEAVEGAVGVATMGLSTGLRSVINLDASVALVQRRYAMQTVVYASQAFGQAALAVALVLAGLGWWALPVSSCIASTCVIASFYQWRRVQLRRLDSPRHRDDENIRSFAVSRTTGGLLLLAITQGDRWLVGSIASHGLLAEYDLAARAAALPRFIVAAISNVVLPQRARREHSSPEAARLLYRRAQAVAASVSGAVSLLVLFAALVAVPLARITWSAVGLVLLLLVGNGINALTVTGAMFVNAQLRPDRELPYLYLAGVVFVLVAAVAAVVPGGGSWSVYAAPAALTVGSLFFLFTKPWLRRDITGTTDVRPLPDGPVR